MDRRHLNCARVLVHPDPRSHLVGKDFDEPCEAQFGFGSLDGHKPLHKLDKSKQSGKKCAYWDDILIAQTR